MKRIKGKIIIILFIVLTIISSNVIYIKINKKNNEVVLNEDRWIAYFCPSTTNVAYGDDKAYLVEFDSDGNVKKYKEKAYPLTGLLNTCDYVLFQTELGLGKFNKNKENIEYIETELNDNTCGYTMSGELKDNIYYFFSNKGFTDSNYLSKLIISDLNDSKVHDIDVFINEYGSDDKNIYILGDVESDRNSKVMKKISVDKIDDVKTESNTINFGYRLEGFGQMIITDDYIYSYVNKDGNSACILKISKETLKLEETFEANSENGNLKNYEYRPLSENSIFNVNNKIYCITEKGEIISFNMDTNEFLQENSLEGYDMNSNTIACDYYDEENKEYYLLSLNTTDNLYYLNSYSIDGSLVKSIKLDKLNLNEKFYPHSIIKE